MAKSERTKPPNIVSLIFCPGIFRPLSLKRHLSSIKTNFKRVNLNYISGSSIILLPLPFEFNSIFQIKPEFQFNSDS